MVLGTPCYVIRAQPRSIDSVSRLRYLLSSCQRVCGEKLVGGCRILISYSYDRYWMGRSTWADVVRNWSVECGTA